MESRVRSFAAFSGNMVPITRELLRYLEPRAYAVKRKYGERGSDNGPAWFENSPTRPADRLPGVATTAGYSFSCPGRDPQGNEQLLNKLLGWDLPGSWASSCVRWLVRTQPPRSGHFAQQDDKLYQVSGLRTPATTWR